jgi:hypothetical protein
VERATTIRGVAEAELSNHTCVAAPTGPRRSMALLGRIVTAVTLILPSVALLPLASLKFESEASHVHHGAEHPSADRDDAAGVSRDRLADIPGSPTHRSITTAPHAKSSSTWRQASCSRQTLHCCLWSSITHRRPIAGISRGTSLASGSGASTACAQPTDSRPANRFSCNGTFPVGPERSVVTRTASPERKLMLMNAMSEFDASNRNCRIGKRLEAFH